MGVPQPGAEAQQSVALFDRLKAELPARHGDRLQVANLSVNLTDPPITEQVVNDYLRRMLASALPSTLAAHGLVSPALESPAEGTEGARHQLPSHADDESPA